MLRIIFLLLLTYNIGVSARMYQWTDPDSGSTQLSGSPPMWYRSVDGGPRVFVFENSRVVDDTGIAVSDDEREHLRQQAFLRAEEDRAMAKEKLLKAKTMDAALQQKKKMEDAAAQEQAPVIEEAPVEIAEEKPPEPEQLSTQEKMREVIEAWEKIKTEKARELLGSPATTP
jgi:hypothetical protein